MNKATIGKMLGGVGLLLLLSAPVSYVITGEPLITGIKATAGAVLIAVFFATHYGQLGQFASGRASFFVTNTVALVLVVTAALTAVNYIAAKRNKTWDVTATKLHTLAPQTQTTLAGLPEKVRAIGFLPPDSPYYAPAEALLARYAEHAPDKFEYSFKDPRRAPDLAARYKLTQGELAIVLARGAPGAESHTTLRELTEEALTNELIKLGGVGEQKLYFLAGHGEWPLEKSSSRASLSELARQLSVEGYSPQPLSLLGKTEVPKDAALVVIAGARTPLTEAEVNLLRAYLEVGGRLLYFAELNAEPGVHAVKLLEEYGFEVDPGLVADDRFAVDSPYMLLSMFFADHPITRLLQEEQLSVQIPSARGLTLLRSGTAEGVTTTPLVLTSQYAWVEATPGEDPARSPGEKTGQIPLVAVATRPTASVPNKRFDEARVVVFGDSELIADVNWGHEGNRNLVMNAFGWASNQLSRITLRPPSREVSTLQLSESALARIRFVTMDLLPISLLGIGLAIWLRRRAQ